MKIAFCTTCKGRTQHLRQTLPRNMADNPGSLFVVLDYNSDDGLLRYLLNECAAAVNSGQLVVYQTFDQPVFRMAHAKNMVHRCALREGADILVNMDADNFAGPFEKYAAAQFWSHGRMFLWANMIKGVLPRGINGRIAVPADAFLKVGGYDEKYETYSPDDKDFNYRLRAIGYAGKEIPQCYLEAIRHNDKMRFKEYPHIADDPYSHEIERHKSAVVNGGAIGLGTVYRDFGTDPIVIGRVPTRIFGIGMHKTATTSLHHALQLLGLDSAHWISAHWAKWIWQEMNQQGYSLTLEQHYALSDLPIPLLYRKLDQAYPGSKFILTTKHIDKWLVAAKNHFNPKTNKWRVMWDTDPFSHQIHERIYGRRDFDRDVFRERYLKHNADVLEYFADRPDDLLVMNMDDGAGWADLCAFLDRPIPQLDYPRSNPDASEKALGAHGGGN